MFCAILTPGIILDHVSAHTDASSNAPAYHFLDFQYHDLHLCSASVTSSYGYTLDLALSPTGTSLSLIFQTLKFNFLTSTSSFPHPIFASSHKTFLTSSTHLAPSLFFPIFSHLLLLLPFPLIQPFLTLTWPCQPFDINSHQYAQFLHIPLVPLHLPCQSPSPDRL